MQKIGDAGKQKHPSMAYTLSNKCNKNCCKRSIIVQLSVYFVPFLSYLTLKNIVTMKCRLWVNHNANLCNMHDLYMVEICSHGAIFFCWQYGSIFIHFYTAISRRKLCRVRWCITTIQGHSGSSQLGPMESPYFDFLLSAHLLILPTQNYWLKICIFSPFYAPQSRLKPHKGCSTVAMRDN